jgi:hypothetical protein
MLTPQTCKTDHGGVPGVDDMTVLIGIMADSHGQADAIRNALAVFADAGCRSVYHPEIAWLSGGQVQVKSLAAGAKLYLSERIPCVVTCGALTRGLCMIWNPEENDIESISFHYSI